MIRSWAPVISLWILVGCASGQYHYVPPQNDLAFLESPLSNRAIDTLNLSPFHPAAAVDWNLPYDGDRPPRISEDFQLEVDGIAAELRQQELISISEFSLEPSDCSGYGARALMNGRIEICRGSLQSAQSRSELAFLICHEIGHLLLGDLSADRISWSRHSKFGSFEYYDPEREGLADLVGIDLCAASGFDPYGSYYALEKFYAQVAVPTVDSSFKAVPVRPQSDALVERRRERARDYLRMHYPRSDFRPTQEEGFRYFTASEQRSMNDTYRDFLVVARKTRRLEIITNTGEEMNRPKHCNGMDEDLAKLAAPMHYDRDWVATTISYAWLCKSWGKAALILEPATHQPRASGNLLLAISLLYDQEGRMSSSRASREHYDQLALKYFEASFSQSLYEKPFNLNHMYVAYALSDANEQIYFDLKQRFSSYCYAHNDPYPEMHFTYLCTSGRIWKSTWRGLEDNNSIGLDDLGTLSPEAMGVVKGTSQALSTLTRLYPSSLLILSDEIRAATDAN